MSIDAAHRRRTRTAKLAVIYILAVAVLTLLTSCTSVPPVIKIGLVGPFEGRHRDVAYDAIYGARLAVREENARDNIGDYRIALVALDDFGDPSAAQEVAQSLVLDPAVVAVVGHWLPETTEAASPIYEAAGLPFVPAGVSPFGRSDPESLPAEFGRNYADVTPFDEVAGPFAGAGYDSIGLILKAISQAAENERTIDRTTIGDILTTLVHNGITGNVHVPR
jgi:ABC-type branched-subunit amino acid transport system substrate-binding protein